MRKFLFLDFDGVLRHGYTKSDFACPFFDPAMLKWFRRAMSDYPEWNIVVISSWRHNLSINYMASQLELPVYGVTPEDLEGGDRLREICMFLIDYPGAEWVVIDDDRDLFPTGMQNIVYPESIWGFDERCARELGGLL